jgi:ATP synthase protein I
MAGEHSPEHEDRHDRGAKEADLSARLHKLGERLDALQAGQEQKGTSRPASVRDATGLSRAVRITSEFIAGIVVGGLIGWFIDYVAGTLPWGMIVFVLLGFVAGVFNVLRTAGLMAPQGGIDPDSK